MLYRKVGKDSSDQPSQGHAVKFNFWGGRARDGDVSLETAFWVVHRLAVADTHPDVVLQKLCGAAYDLIWILALTADRLQLDLEALQRRDQALRLRVGGGGEKQTESVTSGWNITTP